MFCQTVSPEQMVTYTHDNLSCGCRNVAKFNKIIFLFDKKYFRLIKKYFNSIKSDDHIISSNQSDRSIHILTEEQL